MARISLVYFDLHTGHYPGFNHGLAYLIGAVRAAGHEVTLEHIVSEGDFVRASDAIAHTKPDVLGLSFTTNQKQYVHRFFDAARSFLSGAETRVLAGGVHATLVKQEVLQEFPDIQGVCVGEGEGPLALLCEKLDAGGDIQATPSFIFREKDGSVIENPVAPLREFAEIALPDYSLFDYERIIRENGETFPVMLSRGCSYSCHYCCNHILRRVYPNHERYVRFASVGRAISIIQQALKLYPATKKVQLDDDTLTLNRRWVLEFCRVYKDEINLPFVCNVRVETIKEDIACALKEAGCTSVNFGVESGSEWVRRYVLNRRHSNAQIQAAFDCIQAQGIRTFSFNMVGLPFETEEMVRDTWRLNRDIRPSYGACFFFYPYPGTRLYSLCEEYGLLEDDLESVSGYWEKPSVKPVFLSHRKARDYFERMRVFFYVRLALSGKRVPRMVEGVIIMGALLFRRPLLWVLEPNTSNRFAAWLRSSLRKRAMRDLR